MMGRKLHMSMCTEQLIELERHKKRKLLCQSLTNVIGTELNRGFPIQSLRNDVRDVTNLNPQHIHEQA